MTISIYKGKMYSIEYNNNGSYTLKCNETKETLKETYFFYTLNEARKDFKKLIKQNL